MAAASAFVDMTAEYGRTTARNGQQHFDVFPTDPRTVSFDDGSGTTADIPQNGSFEFKFDKPGTYPYHCTQHPFMKGVVIVRG